jgi:hypothetical protein
LPAEFAKRVTVRYGSPVVGVAQDDREASSDARRCRHADGGPRVFALPCPVIGDIFAEARLSDATLRAIREQRMDAGRARIGPSRVTEING